MGVPLAVIAEETVKALPKRIAFRSGKAQPPFSKGARRVSLNAKHLRQRPFALRKRTLSFRADFAVIAHEGVAGMPPRQQHAPRRRAHRTTRITLGKTHSRRRQPVNPRRPNLALPVASQFRITEIIRQNENNVRSFSRLQTRAKEDKERRRNRPHRKKAKFEHFQALAFLRTRQRRLVRQAIFRLNRQNTTQNELLEKLLRWFHNNTIDKIPPSARFAKPARRRRDAD